MLRVRICLVVMGISLNCGLTNVCHCLSLLMQGDRWSMYSMRVMSADRKSYGKEKRYPISVDPQKVPAVLFAFSEDIWMYVGVVTQNSPEVLCCLDSGVNIMLFVFFPFLI